MDRQQVPIPVRCLENTFAAECLGFPPSALAVCCELWPMLCSVRLAFFGSCLRIAFAEADVCRDQGACRDSKLLRRQTKILRGLLRKNIAVLNSNVIIEGSEGSGGRRVKIFEITAVAALRSAPWLKPQQVAPASRRWKDWYFWC